MSVGMVNAIIDPSCNTIRVLIMVSVTGSAFGKFCTEVGRLCNQTNTRP